MSRVPLLLHLQEHLDPLFYVRLVGPAIVIGEVKRYSFTNFTIGYTAPRYVLLTGRKYDEQMTPSL